jgi:hypothetical protein
MDRPLAQTDSGTVRIYRFGPSMGRLALGKLSTGSTSVARIPSPALFPSVVALV